MVIESPEGLRGEQLSAVAFVMDYVEFHFNGPILRALSRPRVERSGTAFEFPQPGSRDAFCSLIGHIVLEIVVRDDTELRVQWDDGSQLLIPLDEAYRGGAEAAHFVPGEGQPIQVW